MDILPNEMLCKILSYVDFEYRIVCKEWKQIKDEKNKLERISFVKNLITKNRFLEKERQNMFEKFRIKLIWEYPKDINAVVYDQEQDFIRIFLKTYIISYYVNNNIGKIEINITSSDYIESENIKVQNEIIKKIQERKYEIHDIFFINKYNRNRMNRIILEKQKIWKLPCEIIYEKSYEIKFKGDSFIYTLSYDCNHDRFYVTNKYKHNLFTLSSAMFKEEYNFYEYIIYMKELALLM